MPEPDTCCIGYDPDSDNNLCCADYSALALPAVSLIGRAANYSAHPDPPIPTTEAAVIAWLQGNLSEWMEVAQLPSTPSQPGSGYWASITPGTDAGSGEMVELRYRIDVVPEMLNDPTPLPLLPACDKDNESGGECYNYSFKNIPITVFDGFDRPGSAISSSVNANWFKERLYWSSGSDPGAGGGNLESFTALPVSQDQAWLVEIDEPYASMEADMAYICY